MSVAWRVLYMYHVMLSFSVFFFPGGLSFFLIAMHDSWQRYVEVILHWNLWKNCGAEPLETKGDGSGDMFPGIRMGSQFAIGVRSGE